MDRPGQLLPREARLAGLFCRSWTVARTETAATRQSHSRVAVLRNGHGALPGLVPPTSSRSLDPTDATVMLIRSGTTLDSGDDSLPRHCLGTVEHMASSEANELGNTAVRLGLVTEDQRRECIDDLSPVAPASALIEALERKQFLTAFQSQKLLRGDTIGYFLGG